MDENKIYDLLEKMYGDMQGMKNEINDIKANMATKQDLARLEHKMDDNQKALYDGYQLCYEGICDIREDMDDLKKKVETHEIKLQIVK